MAGTATKDTARPDVKAEETVATPRTQVDWDGPNDPEHPRNWSTRKKWTTLLPMSLFNFLSSMSSATMAPALVDIARELHFTKELLVIFSLSIFLLGTAAIPLMTAPLSEVFGRSLILQSMNLFYIIFNTLCGVAKTPGQLIAYRFLAGWGGAGPFAVSTQPSKTNTPANASRKIGSGINADLFHPRERGQAIAVFTLAPLIGVAAGPIAGGFLVQYVSWPWCFYVVSIAGGAVQLFGVPFFRETFAPVLLQRRCRKLKKSTNNPNLYTQYDETSLAQLLRASINRPFVLLCTQPIVQVWSLYCAYLWGTLYLLIATFPNVWTDIYKESISIGSLNYLSLFVGMGIASQVGTRLADRYYKAATAKNGGQSNPEFRLPVLIIGACIVPVGLFWYGWSARPSVHWIMPYVIVLDMLDRSCLLLIIKALLTRGHSNIGAAIYGAGTVLEILCVMGYIIDTYQKYAASAMAAIIVLRSILAAVLPLAAPAL